MGCLLFGTLKGITLHTAVDSTHPDPGGDGVPAHLAMSDIRPWEAIGAGEAWAGEAKLVVEDQSSGYVARMVRWPAGSSTPRHVHADAHAALIIAGGAVVDGQTLGPWDLIYGAGGVAHGGIHFPEECTLIVNSLGDVQPGAVN